MNWHDESTATAPPREPRPTSFGESMHELVSLLELQAELFRIDLRECSMRLVIPAILIVGAFVLAVACVPIALLVVVELLIEAGMVVSMALLIVAAAGFGVAAALALISLVQFRNSLNVFIRSGEEWRRTADSIKQMLRSARHADDGPDLSAYRKLY